MSKVCIFKIYKISSCLITNLKLYLLILYVINKYEYLCRKQSFKKNIMR